MHSKTPSLRRAMVRCEGIRGKLDVLRDAYIGETAILFSCGPSFDPRILQSLTDPLSRHLTFAVKQTYRSLPFPADFHLLNPFNFQFTEHHPDTIVTFQRPYNPQDWPMPRISVDLDFPMDPYLAGLQAEERAKHWLVRSQKFEEYEISRNVARPWGPGIVIEMGLYLALHLGISRLVVVGWDMKPRKALELDLQHFYDAPSDDRCSHATVISQLLYSVRGGFRRFFGRSASKLTCKSESCTEIRTNEVLLNPIGLDQGENEAVIQGSCAIYDFFKSKGMEILLASNCSHLDSQIPRTTLAQILVH
jgi:hypothetical protein